MLLLQKGSPLSVGHLSAHERPWYALITAARYSRLGTRPDHNVLLSVPPNMLKT